MKKTIKRIAAMLLCAIVMISTIPTAKTASAANYTTHYWNYSVPTRTLYYKKAMMYGNDVRWLQSAINDLISRGDKNNSKLKTSRLNVDGYYGTACVSAVKAFERKYGYYVDGKLGTAERNKLKSILRVSPTKCSHTSYTFGYNGGGNAILSQCRQCLTVDSATTYEEYLKYSRRANTVYAQRDYFRIAAKALCKAYTNAGRENFVTQMVNIRFNSKASTSNILVYQERPDGTSSFYNQAKAMRDNYYSSEKGNTKLIKVSYMDQFIFIWNYVIPSKVKNIHLFLHGQQYLLYFYDGADDGLKIDDMLTGEQIDYEQFLGTWRFPPKPKMLFKKQVTNKVYLYSCQGGTYDESYLTIGEKYSMARTFARLCPNAYVVALQGNEVDYNPITYKPERHSLKGQWIMEKYSTSQTGGGKYVPTFVLGTKWKL
ncbi:MAG: peptidoglycan-binding protein [Ruminococcus sp.]|nr:peptidoglycan-binding protein [Ruminococcus sp.]